MRMGIEEDQTNLQKQNGHVLTSHLRHQTIRVFLRFFQ